ncbi:hypothetical protein SAMN04487936_101449 [Halobacillus dabanensis]|uniref:Uncharacterized protein n=1 Tax=Halobacillus dabanensis TaxID=240302 RepID=A0A1I3PUZ7_HALDA|nr:hypothetical protein [Halobacillus dabanensis]SFJ25225.1 hypothetical protein SAMN04487936_101449 [Halobacillus dabanensis]
MRIFIVLLCSLLFPFLAYPTITSGTSWAYKFVVWNDFIYVVDEDKTENRVENAGKRIGEVTVYSDMNQHKGNFSNAYEEGTGYYKIIGVPTSDTIAVEVRKGVYLKAEREGIYGFKGEQEAVTGHYLENGVNVERNDLLIGTLVFFGFLSLLVLLVYHFQKNRT